MERWSLVECRTEDGLDRYLDNPGQTEVKAPRWLDVQAVFRKIEEVGLPLRFTEGLVRIRFTRLAKETGLYVDDADGENGEVIVDVSRRRPRRLSTIVAIIVHEVGHHLDFRQKWSVSARLTDERERTGRLLCKAIKKDDTEYLARGFEWFYSPDPRRRQALRRRHPRLYRAILGLHRRRRNR